MNFQVCMVTKIHTAVLQVMTPHSLAGERQCVQEMSQKMETVVWNGGTHIPLCMVPLPKRSQYESEYCFSMCSVSVYFVHCIEWLSSIYKVYERTTAVMHT